MKVFSINGYTCKSTVIKIIKYFQYNTNFPKVWHYSCVEFQANRKRRIQSKGTTGPVLLTAVCVGQLSFDESKMKHTGAPQTLKYLDT